VLFTYSNGFNVSCNGVCDGSLQAVLSGGTGIITSSWTGPNGFTSTDLVLNNLCAGTYILTTEDENNCTQETQITLTTPAELQVILNAPTFAGGTEIACNGESNGAIFTTVGGGTPEYTYAWNGPNGYNSSEQNPDNLFAGTYQVEVTDAGGCTTQASVTMNEPESALSAVSIASIFPSGNNVGCLGGSNGSITTTTAGGIPQYLYNWLGPNDFSASTADINNLQAGIYVLVVQDLNSCVYTVMIELDEPETAVTTALTVDSEILCLGTSTGALTVAAALGTPGYTIQWVGTGGFVSNDFSISNLPAGTYTYAVTDANGCSAGDAYVLIDGPALQVEAIIVNPQCDAADGSISITVSGGLEPYVITWSNGSTGESVANLNAGTYSATVIDFNGCEQVETFIVESTNSLTLNPVLSQPACYGESTGTIDIVVIQGEQPIVYAWSGPDDFTSDNEDINNVPAGEYQLLAIDANGCIAEFDLTLGQPDSLYIVQLISPLFPNGFNVSTFGGSDGSIFNPEIIGGSGEYTLYWTGPNGFAFEGTGDLGGLGAGTYRLAVLDEQLCSDTAYVTLREPVTLELPNGISPNGDGSNDALIVRGLDIFPINTVYVYNRWGNLLYEEDNYSNAAPWTGTNESGELLPEGTYFVIVEIPDRDNLRGYLELRR
jgi:gliding motility-associated-like protein